MDGFYSKKILLAIIVLSIILISSCTPEQAQATCGNNIVESGEECDKSACPNGKICSECKCGSLAPPPLPE